MSSQTQTPVRDFDPEDPPRFGEWVRVGEGTASRPPTPVGGGAKNLWIAASLLTAAAAGGGWLWHTHQAAPPVKPVPTPVPLKLHPGGTPVHPDLSTEGNTIHLGETSFREHRKPRPHQQLPILEQPEANNPDSPPPVQAHISIPPRTAPVHIIEERKNGKSKIISAEPRRSHKPVLVKSRPNEPKPPPVVSVNLPAGGPTQIDTESHVSGTVPLSPATNSEQPTGTGKRTAMSHKDQPTKVHEAGPEKPPQHPQSSEPDTSGNPHGKAQND